MLAISSLVNVPLLSVFSLPLPSLNTFVPDSDRNARPRSKFLAPVEDSPCKSCKDEFRSYHGFQTSDFAVVIDGAGVFRRGEKVNVECGALGNEDKETLVKNGVEVLPEYDKVFHIVCMVGCRQWVVRVLLHGISLIL